MTNLSDVTSNSDYNRFQNILCDVLNKHAPPKKKTIRANNSPFMTKQLRKMIMNRSRCKNAYFRNKSTENWEKYRVLRNECVKLTKKVKREYFANLNMNCIKDNRTFWKTVKGNFTNKNNDNGKKIILVENNDIISENTKVAEIMNNYFVNITEDLNIPAIKTITDIVSNPSIVCTDPIEQIILNYSLHPSILMIKTLVDCNITFSFNHVNQSYMENKIKELNPKKATGYDAIPSKILIDAVEIIKNH